MMEIMMVILIKVTLLLKMRMAISWYNLTGSTQLLTHVQSRQQ